MIGSDPFKKMKPGMLGPPSASDYNRLLDTAERNIFQTGPYIQLDGAGIHDYSPPADPLYAIITEKHEGSPVTYSWQRVLTRLDGTKSAEDYGLRGGDEENYPALELNGNEDVPVGTYVQLSPGEGPFYLFDYPTSTDLIEEQVTFGTFENNYDLGDNVGFLSVDLTDNCTLSGVANGTEGRQLWITNRSATYSLTLPHQSGSSNAANRFRLPFFSSIVLGPNEGVGFYYSSTDSRWYCLEDVDWKEQRDAWSAQQDDYALLPGRSLLTVSLSGNQTLTGLTGGHDSRVVWLALRDTTDILTISHSSSSSTSGNRFSLPEGNDLVIHPLSGAGFYYDSTDSVWRCLDNTPNLKVQEVDGSPVYTHIIETQFDQSDGFVLSQPSTGVVKVKMTPATATQIGVMSTSTQTFAGDKNFNNDVLITEVLTIGDNTQGAGVKVQMPISGATVDVGFTTTGGLGVDGFYIRYSPNTGATPVLFFTGDTSSYDGASFIVEGVYGTIDSGSSFVGGKTGTFTTVDGKTITVTNGIITSIV